MLTAGALHGVNHALNHVMSLTMSAESEHIFGQKSVLAVGDLFQLPAVQRYRFKEQVSLARHTHGTRTSAPPATPRAVSSSLLARSTTPPCGQRFASSS